MPSTEPDCNSDEPDSVTMMTLSQTAAVTMHCHMARAGDHSRDLQYFDQALWFVKVLQFARFSCIPHGFSEAAGV